MCLTNIIANAPVQPPPQPPPQPAPPPHQRSISRAYAFANIGTQLHCCACYERNSVDARCCGVCYCCCPTPNKSAQFNLCPITFSEYWYSGCIQTHAGYSPEPPNGVCCWLCFPVKFPLTFTCMLGSLFNNSINWLRGTKLNYCF